MRHIDAAWANLVQTGVSNDKAREQFLAKDDPLVVQVLRRELRSRGLGARLVVLDVLNGIASTRQGPIADMFPDLVRRVAGPDWLTARVIDTILKVDSSELRGLLAEYVPSFIDDTGNDAGAYWGLVELLDRAQHHDLRDQVVVAAGKSLDEDVRNAVRDWG